MKQKRRTVVMTKSTVVVTKSPWAGWFGKCNVVLITDPSDDYTEYKSQAAALRVYAGRGFTHYQFIDPHGPDRPVRKIPQKFFE